MSAILKPKARSSQKHHQKSRLANKSCNCGQEDPDVTLAVTTITGIALAISIQSVIGNAIAGMVLAIVRPFINKRHNNRIWYYRLCQDIGLLYVRLSTILDKKLFWFSNGTMLGTAKVKKELQTSIEIEC